MNLKDNAPLYITILACVALICATIIYAVAPNNPNIPVVFTALFGFVGTVGVGLVNGQATRAKVEQVNAKVEQNTVTTELTHALVNSQSEKLEAAAKIVNTEEGRKMGVAEQKAEDAAGG